MTVEISLHRSYDVPAQRIYDAWTDVEQLREWLCPGGLWKGEVRVGAPYQMNMLYEGKTYEHHGRFLRLEPPSLVEFTWIQQEGTYGTETIVRIEITDLGPSCEMTLTHTKLPDQKQADSHRGGWSDFLEILAKHVGSK
ncbi:SRPBCC family protein [Roseiterribacter gracilis]|uniref:Activator of Hsp90 ATPase homologue 1/2-like C-terminal domain-containing protein n=1 Tax=Roseiterribacter gracilis TaxID=2812848 RepID=A0A8S8XCG5_9PROT|nr:hypothetical protein TMPK1_12220 [Rhodospirillales bacterium TMPK1]